MGMRPGILCHLEKGKMIDSQVGFVDTFNWLVDFCENLKGDGDVSPSKSIKVNRADTAHPVIQLTKLGGGNVTVTGTDGSTATGSSIVIKGGPDTNLSSTVASENGQIVVSIDVYYK